MATNNIDQPDAPGVLAHLSGRELATVLAGLRTRQAIRRGFPLSPGQLLSLDEIATDVWTYDAMTDEEIDELCERLNCGGK